MDAHNPQPVMADLPVSRVQPSRPFSKVEIDYAGPLKIREMGLRKSRELKVYIAVFVCMSMKAVHLELVSNLSTDAFLAALDRFMSQRGLPSDIFSDFVGTSKELYKLVHLLKSQELLAKAKACDWHFNPPSAPHFGGFWEAAMRSTKLLLSRTIGAHLVTIEEISTFVCRVEAVI
jgi:hypothetical protein